MELSIHNVERVFLQDCAPNEPWLRVAVVTKTNEGHWIVVELTLFHEGKLPLNLEYVTEMPVYPAGELVRKLEERVAKRDGSTLEKEHPGGFDVPTS